MWKKLTQRCRGLAEQLSLQSLVFSLKMRHSEAEGAEARSLRSALREWGSFGRGVVLLDGKGGGSTLIGCGLRPAGGADVAGWNADFSLVFINASYLVIGLADADSWLSPASPL